jgi:hypothetical protein
LHFILICQMSGKSSILYRIPPIVWVVLINVRFLKLS